MNIHEIVIWYLGIINVIAIAVYGWDKMCAIRHKWRVPEKTLLAIAGIGGSVGAVFAMSLFHHKTLHLKFKYGVPVIMLLQVALVVHFQVLG